MSDNQENDVKDELQDGGDNVGQQFNDDGSDEDGESPLRGKADRPPQKRAGRRKINIEFIKDKSRRHITFSKRKAGIMKKAYELSTLTGTQVLLLVASETGHVYTFATPKLQPLITKTEGKNLIQACLNAPDPQPLDNQQDGSDMGSGTMQQSMGVQGNYGLDMEQETKKMRGDMKMLPVQSYQSQPMPQQQLGPSPSSSQGYGQHPSLQNQSSIPHQYSSLDMSGPPNYMQGPPQQDFPSQGNFGNMRMSTMGGGPHMGGQFGGSAYGMNANLTGGMDAHKVAMYNSNNNNNNNSMRNQNPGFDQYHQQN